MQVSLKKHELGFFQVDPLPSKVELDEYYSKKYYQESKSLTYQHDYSLEELKYMNAKIVQKSFIIDQIIRKKSKRLLDVGCGEGFVLNSFKSNGWDVHGIDFSDFGILRFNPSLIKYFEKGDIYTILEEKVDKQENYDVIWIGNVLEHVLDPINLLKRLKLLLSKKGVLVITVPNDCSSYQDMLITKGYVSKKYWIAYPDHLSYFDIESLKNIANYAEFYCHEIIADFPIDLFLLHSGSNYVQQSGVGKIAHKARVEFENFISIKSPELVNSFYKSLAQLGVGRDLTAFLINK